MDDKKTVVILYSKDFYQTPALDLAGRLRHEYPDCDVIAVDEDRYCNAYSAPFERRTYIASARLAPWLNRVVTSLKNALLPKKINKTVEPYHLKEKESNPDSFGARMRQKYRKVDNILSRFDPDIVLCFTPKAHNKAIIAKQRLGLKEVKVFAVITDYSLNKAYINYQSDGYFVQNENIKSELLANKVADAQIRVVGMPFDNAKILDYDRAELAEAMGISSDIPTVTISGGKHGAAPIKDAFAALADYSDRLNVIVLTGGSKTIVKFVKSFAKARGLNKNIYVIDEVTDIWKILDLTDVFISTPDIMSIYGACSKNVPCVLIKAINSLQKSNAEYLVSAQIALRGGKDEQLVTAVLSLLNNHMIREEYKYNQRKFYDKTALPSFCKLIHADAEEVLREKVENRTTPVDADKRIDSVKTEE